MDIMTIIAKAYGRKLSQRRERNAKSVAVALEMHGKQFGLLQPHRLAQYLPQLAHESAGFQYDREVWGPTAAQKRYEGRRDLGNTQKGDGKKFSGKGPIQITGRFNTREFTQWVRKFLGIQNTPDFEETPEKINTDPYEGLTGIWYWSTRKLNRYADTGDIEMITRRINGGLNGYHDRIEWMVKFSLVILGYKNTDVRGFQKSAGLAVDGDAGPKTRAALHRTLVKMTTSQERSNDVADAPVVHTARMIPTVVDETVKKESGFWGWLLTAGGAIGGGVTWFMDQDWTTIAAIGGVGISGIVLLTFIGPRLAKSIKTIRETVEG